MSQTRSRLSFLCVLLASIALAACGSTAVGAQGTPDLTGHWTLNRALSQFPGELGFDALPLPEGTDRESARGGHGRPGSGGGRHAAGRRPESADDARRRQQLTDEVREPPPRLTVESAPGAITFSDDRGHSRTFHPNGSEEVTDLGGVPVVTITRWEAGQLAILYEVEEGRQIRYAYARASNPERLVVEVQFIDLGNVQKVTRVYEPANSATAQAAPGQPVQSIAAPPGTIPASAPSQGAFNQKPGAEFRGLTQVGLVVEGLGTRATSCGLSEDTLEAAIAARLKDAGLKVRRNTDEDTYVYVNVNTATVSNGLCVSRYDVSLTTHTTATLSYQPSQPPVLVDVSLLHKGSMAGGTPAAHAEAVRKGVLEYVDEIAAKIRDANN